MIALGLLGQLAVVEAPHQRLLATLLRDDDSTDDVIARHGSLDHRLALVVALVVDVREVDRAVGAVLDGAAVVPAEVDLLAGPDTLLVQQVDEAVGLVLTLRDQHLDDGPVGGGRELATSRLLRARTTLVGAGLGGCTSRGTRLIASGTLGR